LQLKIRFETPPQHQPLPEQAIESEHENSENHY
jgi:hypothetical protein